MPAAGLEAAAKAVVVRPEAKREGGWG